MNPVVLKILRALGLALILTVLTFFADATNLQGLVNPQMAALVAAICVAIENSIQSKSGRALFGAVKNS